MFYEGLLLLIPYYELIFIISTTGVKKALPLLVTLLFSVSYSAVIALLIKLPVNAKIKRIITGIILFVVPVLYLIEFFVYRSFKVFYDADTIINGAGGVVRGFLSDTGRLVFSADGLSRIFLFMLPLFLFAGYCISDKNKSKKTNADTALKDTGYFAAVFLGTFAAAYAVVSMNEPLKLMYDTEYSYQSTVENMGLFTGLRLSVKRKLGAGYQDFELADKNDTDVIKHRTVTGRLIYAEYDDKDGGLKESLIPNTTDTEKKRVFYFELPAFTSDKTDGFAAYTANENRAEETKNSFNAEDIAEAGADALWTDENGITEDEENSGESLILPDVPDPERYGVNTLDIDFSALAGSASGKRKELDEYVAALTPSSKNKYTGFFKGKNLIFFSAEAFSGDIIDPGLTPTLYRLANNGIRFTDYYQPAIAGTTGGEYANLFGLVPTSGGKSMKLMTKQNTWITIGNRLSDEGYYGKTYHNAPASTYGREVTHNRLGYSGGFTAVGNGMEEYLSTPGFPASDLEMLEGTFPEYSGRQPFNIYYMTVSGHGQYGRSINQMSNKNYDKVSNLPCSEIIKCYISNNLELEYALSYLVGELEKAGIADDTVIVLGADHFPYGLDNDASLGHMPFLSELYGYNVVNYLQRDHNRLIIWSGCLEKEEPIEVSSPVSSLDILPTLCNLFGVPFESRLLPGRDVFSDKEALVFDGGYDWKTEMGTYIAAENKFTPASPDMEIPDDYVNQIKKEVRNRMNYCSGVLACDYFNHVFGEPDS